MTPARPFPSVADPAAAPPPAVPRAPRRRLAVVAALALLAGAAACTEQLDAGAACPALCPVENARVRDTVIDAVVLDTSLAGFPLPGEAPLLLLALRPGPDSLDVRAVIRFDSLPGRYFPPAGGDSIAITRVDSTRLRLRLDTSGTRFTQPLTIEAYDVDTAAAVDTTAAALGALFRPARRVGSLTLQPGTAVGDSILLPIANDVFAARAQGSRRLRLGLRLVSAAPARLRIASAQGGGSDLGARITFDPATDTTYRPVTIFPASVTPAGSPLATPLQDFGFVARAPRGALGSDLVVGGAPARRVFARFDVPPGLVDSTTIVRATIELVQRPARGLDATDSVLVRPEAVVATTLVTDVQRAAALTAASSVLTLDSLRLAPGDSGRRVLSIVPLVRAWRSLPPTTQRAIVLRSSLEGLQGGEVRFFSREAAPALRPRLRISYIPASTFGLP